MATRQIKVVITINDGQTKKLDEFERKVRRSGKAVEQVNDKLLKFNRTLFSTTALVGTLGGAFMGISNLINRGADFSRAEESFRRVFGPKSDVSKMIGNFTDVAVDEVAAMTQAIRLSKNDIGLDSAQISQILAAGAVAAKKANVDTAEGVRLVTEAVRTGNIEALDNLNIINKGGTAFQAYESAIRAAAGTMGPAALAIKRKSEAVKLLMAETKDYMFGTADLKDQLVGLRNSVTRATARLGEFLGKALAPLTETMKKAADSAAEFFSKMKENKTFLEMTKRVLGAAAAVGTLLVTLASLKLIVFGLTLATAGIPGLIAAVAAGSIFFMGFEKTISKVGSALKTVGSAIAGVFQLVSSFDEKTGLGTMDKKIADLMVSIGLMTKKTDEFGNVVYDGFLVNLSRGLILTKKLVVGFKDGVVSAVNAILTPFKKLIDTVKNLLNMDTGPWAHGLLDSAESIGKALGIFGAIIGGLKLLKMGGSFISSLNPFSGGSRDGSMSKPFYVVPLGSMASAGKGLLDKISSYNPLSKGNLAVILAKFGKLGEVVGAVIRPFMSLVGVLGRVVIGLTTLPGILAGAVAAMAGILVGKGINSLLEKYTQGTNADGFQGNAVERAMFWLDKKTGILGGHAEKFAQYQATIAQADKVKADMSPQGMTSQVTTPRVFGEEVDKIDMLTEQMMQLKGSQQAEMQKQIEQALSASSEGGAKITQDEMAKLRAFVEALNSSDVAKYTRQMAEKLDQNGMTFSRRMN
jgi:hypothetical protein